ncbi:hypothetical protein GA830_10455 [Mesorhizobium sp. NBSH29]|uniref:hypothetical protein n=1 Tax=Mesorhizobium sp. NBSH29 TaxID=2654249 RepID=UPI001896429D|nr:hypothetical protein [Mesorhizobium sp. NBSH29]QPC87115.1 hypothetical protein GA830_10455 [Mesorhizobium sp. NBSH29]
MKNRITDLNDHLFAQMERLAEEGLTGDKLEDEIKRSDSMVKVADQIVENARLGIQAATLVANHGDRFRKDLPMLSAQPSSAVKQIEGEKS